MTAVRLPSALYRIKLLHTLTFLGQSAAIRYI
jgi:hypothetical protein